MYNLNGSTMNGPPILSVADGVSSAGLTPGICTTTPRTPEILNSVIAMTNPLEYSFPSTTTGIVVQPKQSQVLLQSSDSHSSCSGSPLDSPVIMCGSATTSTIGASVTTPTVQQTCSQLIKAGLKLSLQAKRKTSTGDSSGGETSSCKYIKKDEDSSDDDIDSKSPKSGVSLTAEDEDRRRRRRERNKIAATKCRMKKRERTLNLVTEAEVLESQNIDLKSQVRNLEIERRNLAEMLQGHAPSCMSPDGYQSPVCAVSIGKFLNEIGLGHSGTATNSNINGTKASCDQSMKNNKMSPLKLSQPQKVQKIPSVNTLKFSCRRSQQQQQQQQSQHLQPSSIECALTSMTSIATTTTTRCMRTPIHTPNIECKPLPSMDMGYCEGNGDILTPVYCKAIIPTSNDCYAISSPDSGFIKSPVDIGNYANLQAAIIKSDYIPNCDSGDLDHAVLELNGMVDDGIDNQNTDSTMEFILKSELVDGNDSPYTTVQSADRFLFDGATEAFDADLESPTTNSNHLPGGGGGHSVMIHNQNDLHHDTLKEHILVHNNNNNNNNNHSHVMNNNNASNNNNHSHAMNNNSNNKNNSIMIPNSVNSIIEFNNSCQQFVDSSLLKGDFLSHNGEFLALAGDGSDTQFTDLDSGVTTYTHTNGSGCLA